MSDLDEKDQTTKVRPKDDVSSGDKTIVQIAGAKTAWPEPDDTPEKENSDPATDMDADADAAISGPDAEPDTDIASSLTDPWTTSDDPAESPATEAKAAQSDEKNDSPGNTPTESNEVVAGNVEAASAPDDPSGIDTPLLDDVSDPPTEPPDPWATAEAAIVAFAIEPETIKSDEQDNTAVDEHPELNRTEANEAEETSSLSNPSDNDTTSLDTDSASPPEPADPWPTPEATIVSPAIKPETTKSDEQDNIPVGARPELNRAESDNAKEASVPSEPSDIDTAPLADESDEVSTEDVEPPAEEIRETIVEQTVEPDVQGGTALPEDTEPVPEPRIEVPVQQQFASLLAALSDRVQTHPGGHDLLAVLRMLEGQTAPGAAQSGMDPKKADEPAPPRIGKSRRLMEDIVRFGQDPTGEFATSTIERATRDGDNGLVLLERFLGLLGPQGALPSALNDEAIMRGLRGDDSFPRFLDVFNNRFIQLFFRAWADARPIVQHDRPDDDRFLGYLGSSIGIGGPIYQNLDGIDDRLKLLYAGLSSSKAKSAARLKALITGVFGVDVEVDQCVGTWLHLEPDDQLSLGGLGPSGGAGQLGMDTIVGSKIYSVSDKIRVRIFTQSLDEYRKFLPPTRTKPNPWTEKLFDLIDFYLGLEIEYEIELALPKRCASTVRMDSANSATLGHIGWLKPAGEDVSDNGEFDDEEDMLTDTRFRPVRRHTTVYQ